MSTLLDEYLTCECKRKNSLNVSCECEIVSKKSIYYAHDT